jgi:hypothetical protein
VFGSSKPSAAQAAAFERVEAWTRGRFRLAPQTVVLVSELACNLPGCPPLETVIAFWTGDAQRHHCKVFKPVQQVLDDDLPPWWMRDALAVPPDFACDCC